MIDALTGFKYKSWNKQSNLSSVTFNQVNIAFGHNGAGKSSLATGIFKAHSDAGKPKETARFFGAKYVDSTLLLEDKNGIRGVVSNFGERDVTAELEIEKNNKRLLEITDESKRLCDSYKELSVNTETLIKDIVTRRKESNKRINNKPSEKTVEEKVRLWVDDYNKSLKDFPEEDYNKITGGIDYTSENDQVSNLQVFELPEYTSDLVEVTSKVLSKPYTKINIPDNKVITWLQDGLHIHEGKETCEFCGSKIDVSAIARNVESFVNNELHQATVQLEGNKDTLNSIVEAASNTLLKKDIYNALLELVPDFFSDLERSSTRIEKFINENIKDKLQDMSTSQPVPEELESDLSIVAETISNLLKGKIKRGKEILEKINKLETLVKGAIGYEIKNSASIEENLQKISGYIKQLAELDKEKIKLNSDNIELASKKSDLADFSTYLNGILAELDLNFKLVMDGECYILKHADGSPLQVSDISDGERNLLALIYFYYEMLDGSDGTFKKNLELIVIDDPLSSLDDGNKFYISELVKSILDIQGTQVFVLTHSWDDFCNFVYGQNDKENVSRFEISKKSGVSSIKMLEKHRMDKPYKVLYKEVYAFSLKDIEAVNDSEVLHMPNIMRRLLEEYIKFSVDVDFATARKTGDISKALFCEEIASLSNTKKQKLNELLAVCNILSHKATQPKNVNEVLKAAKFLMSSIENSNKYHHLKMRG